MILPSGVWQHYKGGFYLVLGTARDDNGVDFVVYASLQPVIGNPLHLRRLESFSECISIKGESVPRFSFVGQEMK